jgi:hypothetical protein
LVAPIEDGQTLVPVKVGSIPGTRMGRPCGVRPLAQFNWVAKRLPCRNSARRAIENVIETVAICLHQQLAHLAFERRIHQDRDLGSVPIHHVVGVNWKYHFSFPVSMSTATMESV